MKFLKAPVFKPVNFVSAGHFVSQGSWIHSRRCLDSFEIIIGVYGKAYIQQEEDQYIIEPGCVLLLLPGYTHQGYAVSDSPVSFYWFHFKTEYEYEVLEENTAEASLAVAKNNPYFNGLNEYIIIPEFSRINNTDRISILFHQMLHTSQANYYTRLGASYLLTTILIELSEYSIKAFALSCGKNDSERNFTKILEWIRIHYTEAISAEDISARFNYNKDYLSRLFKQKMGMHLQQYIHIIKLDKAKELLYQSEKSIKEIAYATGFQDEKYFMKLFKRYEQTTPSTFRNAYHRTHMNIR